MTKHILLFAFILSTQAHAQTCKDLIQHELSAIGAGSFEQPGPQTEKSSLDQDSRAYRKRLTEIINADGKSYEAYLEYLNPKNQKFKSTSERVTVKMAYDHASESYLKTLVSKQKFEKFRQAQSQYGQDEVRQNLYRDHVDYTKIIQITKGNQRVQVMYDGDRPVAISSRRSGQKDRLLKFTGDCNLNEIVEINHANGASFNYVTASLCNSLPTFQRLAEAPATSDKVDDFVGGTGSAFSLPIASSLPMVKGYCTDYANFLSTTQTIPSGSNDADAPTAN